VITRFVIWLWNLLFGGSSYDLYKPKEMQIYQFFDGQKMVKADPMVLYKRLADVRPELAINIKVAKSTLLPDQDVIKGDNALLDNIRHIFSVKKFEEGGLTEIATTDLLDHFLIWTERLKKNSKASPTLPAETLPLSGPSSAAAQPTPNTSDSGCAKTEPSTDSPEPSHLGPESPAAASPTRE
jgi:hypothetical protein